MSKPQFVYVSYIASTPEKVWAALQDAEMTKLYWGVHKNVSDWQPGSEWKHVDYDTGEPAVVGEVLEAEPPHKLVLSWRSRRAAEGQPPSKVTFLVEAFMGDVRLTVTHEDLSPEGEREVTQGWPAILSSLKSLLETGKPLRATTQRWGRRS